MDLKVERISYDDLVAYWNEVEHFDDPSKQPKTVVRSLGPYKTDLTDPRRESYGLINDAGRIMGATHLVDWDGAWLRYRTLNVRASLRGQDWGWKLLETAIDMDWQDWKRDDRYLFGWVRRQHQHWSLQHGFKPLDGKWHGDHVVMLKPLG